MLGLLSIGSYTWIVPALVPTRHSTQSLAVTDSHFPHLRCRVIAKVTPEDDSAREQREQLLGNLYDDKREEELEVSQDEASHLHAQRDENGEPLLARFTYVDEATCIGCRYGQGLDTCLFPSPSFTMFAPSATLVDTPCRYCAGVARNTFMMEDDYGRARVYNQERRARARG